MIISGLLLGSFMALFAQPWLIRGTIEHAAGGPVRLSSYYGDRFTVIDSLDSESGSFYFVLPEDTPPGVFRIIFSDIQDGIRNQDRFAEFIFNREDTELVISSGEKGPVLYFENSLENLVYKEFLEFELDYEEEWMSLCGQLNSRSGDTAPAAVERYNRIQRERERYMDSIHALYPDLYAVRIMNAFRSPFIPGELSPRERMASLKQHFFDRFAFDDPALLSAPVYTFKLMEYFSLYQSDTLSRKQQEDLFIQAVDRLMHYVGPAPELREFVSNYLLEGFELLDMEYAQMHLAEQYLDETCESDLVELAHSRMKGQKKMVPGEKAADIVLIDRKGIPFQLSELEHSYVLVLFWASTCPHCRDMLPGLSDWYDNKGGFDLEVLAISIDSSEADFSEACSQLDMPWINAHEPLGWLGQVSSDYQVYATPTMFLLDRERTILARPSNFRQLLRALRKLQH